MSKPGVQGIHFNGEEMENTGPLIQRLTTMGVLETPLYEYLRQGPWLELATIGFHCGLSTGHLGVRGNRSCWLRIRLPRS